MESSQLYAATLNHYTECHQVAKYVVYFYNNKMCALLQHAWCIFIEKVYILFSLDILTYSLIKTLPLQYQNALYAPDSTI